MEQISKLTWITTKVAVGEKTQSDDWTLLNQVFDGLPKQIFLN